MAKLLTFVETDVFRKILDKRSSLATLFAIQSDLIADPERGALISGTGGLRKGRISDPESIRGKSSGFCYIYFYLKDPGIVYLLYLYPKSEKGNLTKSEKQELAGITKSIKEKYKN